MDLIISAVSIVTRCVCQADLSPPSQRVYLHTDTEGDWCDSLPTIGYCILLHVKATLNLQNIGLLTFSHRLNCQQHACLFGVHSVNNTTIPICICRKLNAALETMTFRVVKYNIFLW